MTSSDPVLPLLEHAEFLRRLAIHLAGSDADDLLQDTWVASLRRPPTPLDLRAWLSRVATNLWRNDRRTQTRRQLRERTVAPPDAIPAVDEIVAREEVRQRVVAAVLALPEPLREVVLLRYYEGLDSAAISRRIGLPASTIRTRLQTALQRVRVRLDAEHGGHRGAWTAPLACWQAPIAPPAAIPAGAIVFATALLLLALPLAWITFGHEAAAPPVDAATTPIVVDPNTAQNTAAADSKLRSRAPIDVPTAPATYLAATAPPTGSLRVLVLDADTTPVRGVEVTAHRVSVNSASLLSVAEPSTAPRGASTDAQGVCTFQSLAAGLWEVRGGTARLRGRTRVAVGAGDADAALQLRATPYAGLAVVKVVDRASLAVANAAVMLAVTCTKNGPIGYAGAPPIEGRTDHTGVFRFADPDRLEHVFEGSIVAVAPDGRCGSHAIGRPEHRSDDPWFQVVVDEPGTIHGRLTGPLPDWSAARITACPAWIYGTIRDGQVIGTLRTEVAADGTFACARLPAGRYHLRVDGLTEVHRVFAEPPGVWESVPTVTVEPGRTATTTIEFGRPATIVGRVTDDREQPIANAEITAELQLPRTVVGFRHLSAPVPFAPYGRISTRSDREGRSELRLAPGFWQISATAPGMSLDCRPPAEIGAAEIQIDFRLVPDGILRGRTDLNCIALKPLLADPGTPLLVSPDDGAFALRGLAAGTWQIGQLFETGFRSLTEVRIVAGESTWVDLTSHGRIRIRGTLHVNGAPVGDMHVWAARATAGAATARDGSFELTVAAPPSGGVDLDFAHDGVFFASHTPPRTEADDIDLGLIQVQARRLSLRCIDSHGVPTAAAVCFNHAWWPGQARRIDLADGQLTDQLVPLADESLLVTFADGWQQELRLGPGPGPVELVARARPCGNLHLRVVDRDGAPRVSQVLRARIWGHDTPPPMDGATFHAGCAHQGAEIYVRTDGDGRATLRGVAVGPVLIWASNPGGDVGYTDGVFRKRPPPGEVIAVVRQGQDTHVDLALSH